MKNTFVVIGGRTERAAHSANNFTVPKMIRAVELLKWQQKRVISFLKIGRTALFDPIKVQSALERFERKVATR